VRSRALPSPRLSYALQLRSSRLGGASDQVLQGPLRYNELHTLSPLVPSPLGNKLSEVMQSDIADPSGPTGPLPVDSKPIMTHRRWDPGCDPPPE
jgi:hypothetical protein